MGADESGGAQRRDARQQRRQLWRRAQRQRRVLRVLHKAGLLPERLCTDPQERHEMFLQIDAELAGQYLQNGDRAAAHVLPYHLRRLALDEQLPPVVDAVTIAFCDPATVKLLTQAAVRAEEMGTRLFAAVDPPWDGFVDDKNHPYLRAKDGRLIPIHKVRTRRKVNTQTVGKGPRERRVAPGSNHHVEIIAELDATGKEKSWTEEIVTLFEAMERMKNKQPIIQRDHGPNKNFVFSLAKNEYVIMEYEPGEPKLYRVDSISKKDYEFHLHNDARPTNMEGRQRVRCNPGKLFKAKARKVAVDPLGNILSAND